MSVDLPRELAEALSLVRPRLAPLGRDVLYFPTIGSTNDVAAMLAAREGAEGTVVVADAQSAGRGRRGRAWFSPPGAGLYVSLVLAPGRSRADGERATAITTLAAGVALAEAVEAATGLRADIKWPNDLLVGRRKLAGILAEGMAAPIEPGGRPGVASVVLGYGLNVGAASFPPDLGAYVTSLESELGKPVDRAMVFAETLAAMAGRYRDLLEGRFDAILDAWRARAPRSVGARVAWESAAGARTGITAGIDDTGALLVRDGAHVERLVAGEVRWV
jgi:BirA family biotin operon repressor/biotin-[acetyl-CoA-carboxylase] ligase